MTLRTEALAFSAVVLLYIWVPWIGPYSVALPIAAMLFSFWKKGETTSSLGLSWDATRAAADVWWPVFIVLLAAAVWIGRDQLPKAGWRTALYLVWCIVQQFAFQNMTSKRLKNHVVSGGLFGLVHLPNPVLVPATFVWGTISSYLFGRFRSVVVLGLLQFVLSELVFLLTPIAWNHGMRVGPGYWQVH